MTDETAKRVETPASENANSDRANSDRANSERANSDALSRWSDEGGARPPLENAPEITADTTWFVPPIVVPVLLILIIAVRVLALA
jgi:hypothetical protein